MAKYSQNPKNPHKRLPKNLSQPRMTVFEEYVIPTLKTYTELCLVFPDLVIQFGVVQSQTNVGSEELHHLSVLLGEDLLPGVLLVLVDKLQDSQDCSSDS